VWNTMTQGQGLPGSERGLRAVAHKDPKRREMLKNYGRRMADLWKHRGKKRSKEGDKRMMGCSRGGKRQIVKILASRAKKIWRLGIREGLLCGGRSGGEKQKGAAGGDQKNSWWLSHRQSTKGKSKRKRMEGVGERELNCKNKKRSWRGCAGREKENGERKGRTPARKSTQEQGRKGGSPDRLRWQNGVSTGQRQ